ncbi:MAG: hypothetical protein HY661_15120 [Betaproteobacteria bacterium]|nr:hypothetical protein [Betaproteobacteria bacterium]
MDTSNKYASPEEIRYARILDIGVRAGLVALILSFAIYVSGILPPLVPLELLPTYWGLSAKEFVKATHMPTGWGWVSLVGKGDILNLAPIAFLAGVSVICSFAVLPIFARRRELALLAIAVLQIAVLVLAASNIL